MEKLFYFLNESTGLYARLFRGSITTLILISVAAALLQLLGFPFTPEQNAAIEYFEWFALLVFTFELLLRFVAAPSVKEFFNSTVNLIDIVSIVPFYFGISDTVLLRIFRVMRIARFSRESLWNFLERPRTFSAYIVRFGIVGLIITSVSLALGQLIAPELFYEYHILIEQFEYVALTIFTLEFVVRFFAARSVRSYTGQPLNWIDFLAIAPFYVGIDNAVLLRIFRVLRILKLINSFNILRSAELFDLKHSILRVVSPVVGLFVIGKLIIWALEVQGVWVVEANFDTLFTIIGFALGVVLSQKIGVAYGKYLSVENNFYNLHGKLTALQENLNLIKKGKGDQLVGVWLKQYLKVYHGPGDGAVRKVRSMNRELHQEVAALGNNRLVPFHRLAEMLSDIFEVSINIQSSRINRTPLAYNLLLQQTTMIYLLLLIIFLPGVKGLLSVVLAGYLLYGMYHITNDFDDVNSDAVDSDQNLIHVDIVRIERYAKELDAVREPS